MPLGVVIRVLVLVTFVHVGLVGGPAFVAEACFRSNVLLPVVAVAFISMGKRVVLCAAKVDSHRTPFTPGHLISRAFQDLRCHARPCWSYVHLRVGLASHRVASTGRRPV